MEKEREITPFNGPQRHAWVGAIFMYYFHPALCDNSDFVHALNEMFVLDRRLHCVRQAFALDCEKEVAYSWLTKKQLSYAIFEVFKNPLKDQRSKVEQARKLFPGAFIVFVSQFPEHMDIGADVHIGINGAYLNFGSKSKNLVKRVQITEQADICCESYLQLPSLAKYQLLVDSLQDRQLLVRDFCNKRQFRKFRHTNKEA